MKHTPGPWAMGKIGNPYDQYMIYAGGGNIVNSVEGEANARLIASAPDLLEALEEIAEQADSQENDWIGAIQEITAEAINKAKGG